MIMLSRNNIVIDPMLEINEDWNPPCVVAYVEIWFSADAKFGTDTATADAWVNLYAMYNPAESYLRMEYYVETDASCSDPIVYEPTEEERQTVIQMIEEKCMEQYKRSAQEFMKGEGSSAK